MDVAWIALIGTVFGGAGLKAIESMLSRSSTKIDAAAAMREELRKDAQANRELLRQLDKELDAWKEKYFILMQEYLEMKSDLAERQTRR